MAGKFWREAATLMVVGRAPSVNSKVTNRNFQMVFLKRSKKSSFLPNSYVFPGGVTVPSDFSEAWLDIFEKCGYKPSDLLKEFRSQTSRPTIYTSKQHNILPEIGFRIGAIRETFEECGLLLAHHLPGTNFEQNQIRLWQRKVHHDGSQFVTLFQECGGCPAVWNLHEWISWLTPTFIGSHRFNTAFYITFLDPLPTIFADELEVVDVKVCSPLEILKQWQSNLLHLPPPQIYELSRLLNFHCYDELENFARHRGRKGMDLYFPVRISTSNGVISCLPGDDLYPEEPDYLGEREEVALEASLEELRASAKSLHRMEMRGPHDVVCVVKNVCPKYGHLPAKDSVELLKSLF